MHKTVISDGATTYIRISKREARRMFNAGELFYIIAHKMRPGMPFSMGMDIDGAHERAKRQVSPTYPTVDHFFDAMVTEFCWYNANCHETGTYAAYYKMTRVKGTGRERIEVGNATTGHGITTGHAAGIRHP